MTDVALAEAATRDVLRLMEDAIESAGRAAKRLRSAPASDPKAARLMARCEGLWPAVVAAMDALRALDGPVGPARDAARSTLTQLVAGMAALGRTA